MSTAMVGPIPGGATKPVPPLTDPDVQALMRALVGVHVGPLEMPGISQGLLGIVVDGVGVWEVRAGQTLSQVRKLAPVALPFFPTLGYVEGVHLHAPLPIKVIQTVGSFFRWVYQEMKAEAFIRIFYQRDEKGELVFHIEVPAQKVSMAGVKHDLSAERDGWIHWGDIHSHASMNAYWSGTDDNDEQRFEGCAFGVMGKWDTPWPQTKWRGRLGGKFVDLTLSEVVGGAGLNFTGTMNFGTLLEGNGVAPMQASTPLFPVDGFPEEWKKEVASAQATTFQGHTSYRGGTAYPVHHGGGGALQQRPWMNQGGRVAVRAPSQVSKLVKRAERLIAGTSMKGVSLWAPDAGKATWFVDDKLNVWTRPNPNQPLMRLVGMTLKELLLSTANNTRQMYLLGPDGLKKDVKA